MDWNYEDGAVSRSDRLDYHTLRVRREANAYKYLERFRGYAPDAQILDRIELIRRRRELVEEKIRMLSSQKKERFRETLRRRPEVGDVLRSVSDNGVRVRTEIKPDRGNGKTKIYFVYAAVDETGSGWYLSEEPRGIICLLRPSAVLAAKRDGGVLTRVCVISWNGRKSAMICGSCETEDCGVG